MFKSKLKKDKSKRIFSVFMFLCMMLFVVGCEKRAEETTEEEMIEDLTFLAEGVMTYEQVETAQVGAAVVVDVSVKEKSGWEDYKAVILAQDQNGMYIVEELICSETVYNNLSDGAKIRITDYKGESSDQPVITNARFEELEK